MTDDDLGFTLFIATQPGATRYQWNHEISKELKAELTRFAMTIASVVKQESPWIKTIERLPTSDLGCLICLGNITVTAGYYFTAEKGFRNLNCPKEPLLVGVTYWCKMPMAAEKYMETIPYKI